MVYNMYHIKLKKQNNVHEVLRVMTGSKNAYNHYFTNNVIQLSYFISLYGFLSTFFVSM